MESYTSGDKWKQLSSKSNSLSLPIRGPIAFSSLDCEILKYEVKRIVLLQPLQCLPNFAYSHTQQLRYSLPVWLVAAEKKNTQLYRFH